MADNFTAGWASQAQQNDYNRLGEDFLKSLEAGKNVVLDTEFERYLPLFKKASLEAMDETSRNKLAYEYNYRFSPYDPITVISSELDPNGVVFRGFQYSPDDVRVGDGKRHKVVAVYPARFRRLESINAIGEESADIIGLMGAAALTNNGATDPRVDAAYSKVMDAFNRANPDTVETPKQETPKPSTTSLDSDPDEFDAIWDD